MSRPTGKASESAAGRRTLAKMGLALKDGSFPVGDADHWDKARKAIGRVANPRKRAAVARLLRRTAAQYGRTKQLGESWAAPGRRAAHAHANPYLTALEFAVAERLPVSSPFDLVISRGPEGEAIVRHRRGGYEIGRIARGTDGAWMASAGGRDLNPHVRQRGALLELIGTHNKGTASPYRRAEVIREPLQPPPAQTALMQQFGIPAVRALATPAAGAADGPRVTTGLGAKGTAIYKKLRSRGFPHERAHAFAGRAERLSARRSAK